MRAVQHVVSVRSESPKGKLAAYFSTMFIFRRKTLV